MSGKRTAHLIVLEPWSGLSFGERIALEGASALLWPLQHDHRMTVLLNLLATQINNMVETDDQIDALLDVLRKQLKLSRSQLDAPLVPEHQLRPGDPGYVADRFYRENDHGSQTHRR